MNILVLSPEMYNKNYMYFLDSKPNHVVDGIFTKVIYSSPYYTMNGLFLHLPVRSSQVDVVVKYKAMLNFDVNENADMVRKMRSIEHNILTQYCDKNNINKKIDTCFYDALKEGKIRIYEGSKSLYSQYIVKISGIWESESNCGITFKIIEALSDH